MVCPLRAAHCARCRCLQLFPAVGQQTHVSDSSWLNGHAGSAIDFLDDSVHRQEVNNLWQLTEALMMTKQHKPVTSPDDADVSRNAESRHEEETLWSQIESSLSDRH